MGRLVAGVIGAEPVEHLQSREIGGVVGDAYPEVGWLSHDEITAALDGAAPPPPNTDDDDAELLETILDALRSAARSGQDLATVYT